MMFSRTLSLAGKTLRWGSRTYLMGILNVTPDSFSGDGLMNAETVRRTYGAAGPQWLAAAIEQARKFFVAGADILDVGGESTRPGASPVSAEKELERVIPVIRALAQELDVLISIDTYKAEVAAAALEAGAHIVNDVWGLRADPAMGEVVARYRAPVVLMHNRASWAPEEIKQRLGGRMVGQPYDNLLEDVRVELLESVDLAHAAGIPDERIILDPGIGFGKTVAENLELIDCLGEIRGLGYPVLLGPSRKSFIGHTLQADPDKRLEGTAAAVAVGIARGADIVRVHDVDMMSKVARMTDAIVRRGGAS